MTEAANVEVVVDILDQLQDQLRLVQRQHVCPRLLSDLARELAGTGRRGEEGGRAVDGGDQRLGEPALLELVGGHLAHRSSSTRASRLGTKTEYILNKR